MSDLITCPSCGHAAGNHVCAVCRVTLHCQYCGYQERAASHPASAALQDVITEWRQEIGKLEARYDERTREGTLYESLGQHFSSSIVTLRTCFAELAAALSRADQP